MEKMPVCEVEKEFDRLRGYDIVNRVEDQDFCEEICEWALRAFISVTGLAMQTQNTESMADFLDDGGCEALIVILNKHAETNQEIASNGCLVLCILAWSLREMKEFLGEIGACESVVYVASMHVGDPMVSEYGAGAIGLLGKHNIANSLRLSNAGAIEVLAQIGNFGFNLRHERCLAVATNVCLAIAHLSEAVNAPKLLECGMPGLLVALMRFHYESADFSSAAVKAICALSSLNVQQREELGRCGGCEIVIEVLQRHELGSIALLQEGCETMMHMSLSPTNSAKLSAVGACELLVEALRDKLMDCDFGAEVCTGAMLNLSLYGAITKDTRKKLVAEGAIEVLRKTQMSTKASYRARENILKLLELFGGDAVLPLAVLKDSSNSSGKLHTMSAPGTPVLNSSSRREKKVRSVSVDQGGDSKSKQSLASKSSRHTRSESAAASVVALSKAAVVNGSTDSSGGSSSNSSSSNGTKADVEATVLTTFSSSDDDTTATESGNCINSSTNGNTISGGGAVAERKKVSKSSFVGVIHGSEMKGDTVPLQVEVREVIEYDSFSALNAKQRALEHHQKHQQPQQHQHAQLMVNASCDDDSTNRKHAAASMEPQSPGTQQRDSDDSTAIRNSSGVYEI